MATTGTEKEQGSDGNPIGKMLNIAELAQAFTIPIMSSEPWLVAIAGISILLFLVLIILSIVYVVLMLSDITSAGLQSNPLNIQSFENKAISVLGKRLGGKYNYLPFVIIPIVIALMSAGGLYAIYANSVRAHPAIVMLLVILLVLGAALAVGNYFLYSRTRDRIGPVKDRIRLFNMYVNKRISKDPDFLANLLNVSTNPFLSRDAVRNALLKIKPGVSAESLAQYLFTVNMFAHFQKLGERNPYFVRAMETFLPLSIINIKDYRPSDYLYSKATYIEDTSPMYIGTSTSTSLPQDLFRNTKIVNDAAVLTNEWTSQATNLANNFYTRDAFYPFLNLVIMMALLQILIMLPIIWLFWTSARREMVSGFIISLVRRSGPTA